MPTLFWNSGGPALEHYQAKGQTANSEGYCALLTDEVSRLSAQSEENNCRKT